MEDVKEVHTLEKMTETLDRSRPGTADHITSVLKAHEMKVSEGLWNHKMCFALHHKCSEIQFEGLAAHQNHEIVEIVLPKALTVSSN